jgi:lipoprotein signal peptidase
MVISTLAIIGIGVYLFRFCKERMLLKVGLAMIVSGGLGNMVDRIFYGYVIDMIDLVKSTETAFKSYINFVNDNYSKLLDDMIQ